MRLPVQLLSLATTFALAYWLAGRQSTASRPSPTASTPAAVFHLPWSERLAEDAAKATQGLQGTERSFQNLAAGLRKWALTDPAAAWAFIQTLPEEGWRQHFAKDLLERGTLTPALAEQLWAALPAAWQSGFLAERLAHAYLPDQLKAGLARAQLIPVSPAQAGLLKVLLHHWALQDPEAARVYLTGREQNRHLQEMQLSVAIQLGKTDPAKAYIWLSGLTEKDQKAGFSSIWAALAEQDLDTALAMLENVTPPAAAVAALAAKLVERGGADAENWAQKFMAKLSLEDQKTVATALFAALAKKDPTKATQSALAEAEPSLQAAKLAAAAQTWALAASGAALAFAKTLPPDQAAALYRSLLSGSGAGKTEELGTLLPTRVTAYDQLAILKTTDPIDSVNASSLAAKWAESQPREALEWANSLAASDAREAALDSSLHLGMEAHFETTRTWYEAQSSEVRDLGLAGAARGAAKYHPEVALAWVQQSSQPQAPELMVEIYQNWQQQAPAAAQQWRQNAQLNDAQRNQLQ